MTGHATLDFRAMINDVTAEEEAEVRRKIAEHAAEELEKHCAAQFDRLRCPAWFTVEGVKRDRWPEMAELIAQIIENPRNVLVTGPTDHGKSHALCAIARELSKTITNPSATESMQRRSTIFRLKEHEFHSLWDVSRYRHCERYENVVEEAIKADVLVYEDLGKVEITSNGGFALTTFGCALFTIFDARAESRKLNLVSSRYDDLAQLQRAAGVDTVRRILQYEAGVSRGIVLAKVTKKSLEAMK